MATPILAGTKPASLSAAEQAAQIMGYVGDVRAMLHGALSMMDDRSHESRLLSMALDRTAEAYERVNALTIALDEAAGMAHG